MATTAIFINIDFRLQKTPQYFGDPRYVLHRGHMVLLDTGLPVHVTMNIDQNTSAGFSFDPAGPLTSTSVKANKATAAGPDPIFSQPVLSNGNTTMDFNIIQADGKHYYYSLFFIDPNGNKFNDDPIIVNK